MRRYIELRSWAATLCKLLNSWCVPSRFSEDILAEILSLRAGNGTEG